MLTYQIQFYRQVYKSELNGIEIGSVVEIENEDQSGYWFASVCSSKGVLMKYVKKFYFIEYTSNNILSQLALFW